MAVTAPVLTSGVGTPLITAVTAATAWLARSGGQPGPGRGPPTFPHPILRPRGRNKPPPTPHQPDPNTSEAREWRRVEHGARTRSTGERAWCKKRASACQSDARVSVRTSIITVPAYHPRAASGRLRPPPCVEKWSNAAASRLCTLASPEPCKAGRGRTSRKRSQGAATPANERRLCREKSTAITARRCAPPRSVPSLTNSVEHATITQRSR